MEKCGEGVGRTSASRSVMLTLMSIGESSPRSLLDERVEKGVAGCAQRAAGDCVAAENRTDRTDATPADIAGAGVAATLPISLGVAGVRPQ